MKDEVPDLNARTVEFGPRIVRSDSLKEIDETAYWLELPDRSTLIPSAKLLGLRDEADQLTAIFTSIAKTAKSRKSP